MLCNHRTHHWFYLGKRSHIHGRTKKWQIGFLKCWKIPFSIKTGKSRIDKTHLRLKQGYHVDNWFTSVKYLKHLSNAFITTIVGTMRKYKIPIPAEGLVYRGINVGLSVLCLELIEDLNHIKCNPEKPWFHCLIHKIDQIKMHHLRSWKLLNFLIQQNVFIIRWVKYATTSPVVKRHALASVYF